MNNKLILFFPTFSQQHKELRNTIFGQYKFGIWFRSNPASKNKIKEFANKKFIGFKQIFLTKKNLSITQIRSIAQAHQIVFAYRDSIGLNCTKLEKQIYRLKSPACCLLGINGRNRTFKISRIHLLKLRLLRILEKSLLVEIFTGFMLIIITPIFALIDFVQEKK